MECGSLARCALDGDRASMGEDDVFDDGEAEAGAAHLPAAALINAVEALE